MPGNTCVGILIIFDIYLRYFMLRCTLSEISAKNREVLKNVTFAPSPVAYLLEAWIFSYVYHLTIPNNALRSNILPCIREPFIGWTTSVFTWPPVFQAARSDWQTNFFTVHI